MENKKLKVLMVSEASFLSSGFGTYAREILKRLYATEKYDIAEFACYGKVNDPKDASIHWRYYANAVDGDDRRAKEYNSSMENQFGKWRFERVLLDFQPDVVIDVRDYWMNSYQEFSPLRPYFHWAIMPTVDSAPQQEDWIDTYMHADAVFTYSDFGRDTLLKQSNNKIKYIDTASPGVDLNVYKPIDNRENVRKAFNFDSKFIIGSVMRNQKRKLIPELFATFKKIIDISKNDNAVLAKNIYLYLHTSFPDAGWDIPELLKEYEIGNRVLFTYSCKSCSFYRPMLYRHPITYCPRCGKQTFSMPNVSNGLPESDLNVIFNTFDLYVQYAICEGFGMPQVEAAAAGVPVASVNYSAMMDVVNKLNGYPIRVNQYFKELETRAIRVYPDNDDLIKIIQDYYSMPDFLKAQKRHESRQLTEKYYDWNNIAKKWENYLDNINLTGLQGKWDYPMQPITNLTNLESNKKPYDTIVDFVSKSMPHHQMVGSIRLLKMIENLDYNYYLQGLQPQKFDLENAKNILQNMIDNHNKCASAKNNMHLLKKEDFIEYANMKENTK